MRKLLLITLLATIAPCLSAQRRGFASPHFSARAFSRYGGYARPFSYPLGFADPLFADYLYGEGYPVASQPPVIFMQAPPADSPHREMTQPVEPLMIELQGDRYVRVSGEDKSGAETEMIGTQPGQTELDRPGRTPDIATATPQRSEASAVVLVFRDGHREEASDYTIAGGVLYARSNYYADGSWTKKIELSSLNLPETVASNRSRGAPFRLPTAPNEVIVGP